MLVMVHSEVPVKRCLIKHPEGMVHSRPFVEGSSPKWQRTWAPTTHAFFSAEGLRGAGTHGFPNGSSNWTMGSMGSKLDSTR